jgi:hypothetical protein
MMNVVKTDIKNLQDIAPLIDDDIIAQYNEKYRKYKKVKKPNFVNGLTEVKVNSAEDDLEYASRQCSREPSPERTAADENANNNNNNGNGNDNANHIQYDYNDENSVDNPPMPLSDTRIIIQNQNGSGTSTPARSIHSHHSNTSLAVSENGVNAIVPSGTIRQDSNGNSTLSA